MTGETINLVALGINNGWIDPLLQYQAYPMFAYENGYNQLVTERQYNKYMTAYTDTCVPAYAGCTNLTGDNSACLAAGSACASAVESPIERANDFSEFLPAMQGRKFLMMGAVRPALVSSRTLTPRIRRVRRPGTVQRTDD